MRIACLQFSPVLGDVDNNLNRADAVLSKAKPEDLDDLDLMVLPELAFTGYSFKSLQHISPFLEPSGSGISALWARTTALKYNCNVIVGYPEKVDVTDRWPTSPEYYNSAIVVNGDGETIANYRKNFLYAIDETWALEGKDGFFHSDLPGLGQTAMGICMDLNPYKFEAPWHAFEFAFHVLEVESNLVIVTMSWLTREDGRKFSRMPQEPDLDTLTYWVQRLEPLIRAERDEEIIVVFCNRTGYEGDIFYAGTSAVIGIKDGEVVVYGLLGRGVKELLVVDTTKEPFAKLVYRPDCDPVEAGTPIKSEQQPPGFMDFPTGYIQSSQSSGEPKEWPKVRASSPTVLDLPNRSPKAIAKTVKGRRAPQLSIPNSACESKKSRQAAESPTVPTPTGPSPVSPSLRPKLIIPEAQPRYQHNPTPYPRDGAAEGGPFHIYGGDVSISQDILSPTSERSDIIADSPSSHTTSEKGWLPIVPDSPTLSSSLMRIHYERSLAAAKRRSLQSIEEDKTSIKSANGSVASTDPDGSVKTKGVESVHPSIAVDSTPSKGGVVPSRPSSPKSRNASRQRHPERRGSEIFDSPDMAAISNRLESLARRPGSAIGARPNPQGKTQEPCPVRPASPKSRHASRTRDWDTVDPVYDERVLNLSRASIPIAASPSIFQNSFQRPESSNTRFNPGPRVGRAGAPEERISRPDSRAANNPRSNSGSGIDSEYAICSPDALRSVDLSESQVETPLHRSVMRSPTPNVPQPVFDRPQSRAASRGRSREATWWPVNSSQSQFTEEIPRQGTPRRGIPRTGSSGHWSTPPIVPRDDIIEIHEFIDPHCQLHGHQRSPPRIDDPQLGQDPDELGRYSPHGRIDQHGSPHTAKDIAEPSGSEDRSESVANSVRESLDPSPPLAGSSIMTLSSPERSPGTPPFEPATPKAMVFAFPADKNDPRSLEPPPVESQKCETANLTVEGLTIDAERPKSGVF